jgi:signal transduction histidine kinase
VVVALFNVAVRRSTAQAVGVAAAFEVGVVLIALNVVPGALDRADIVSVTALAAVALLLGMTVRSNRRYLESLQERARRLEREREQQERLTAAAERTRIAREMHDIVAHGLSVVITLSQGAAANVANDPVESREAMQQVADAARHSLWEMRRLLDVLRDDASPARRPQPGLDGLEQLLEDVRATGLAVRLERTGEPDGMGPAVEATLFRIVQESLTNVVRHAKATAATVRIQYGERALVVQVDDDGRSLTGPPQEGNGLIGMRERATALGGTLTATRTPTGGLRIVAQLPLEALGQADVGRVEVGDAGDA